MARQMADVAARGALRLRARCDLLGSRLSLSHGRLEVLEGELPVVRIQLLGALSEAGLPQLRDQAVEAGIDGLELRVPLLKPAVSSLKIGVRRSKLR